MQNQVKQFCETHVVQINITLLIHKKEIISIQSTIVKVYSLKTNPSHCCFY